MGARVERRSTKAAVLAFCLCIILPLALINSQKTKDWVGYDPSRVGDGLVDRVGNETLGFEHIYAIGLKERTDKRDYLTLAASITGIRVEWLDGVRADEISPAALPGGLNESYTEPNVIGCWRAHMNALHNIIENRYSTALILEDDADWDVSLKLQLREVARGVRELGHHQHDPKDTPYGTDWDILWIGGCASAQGANETELYAIPNDPTVPSVEHRGTWGGPTEQWKKQHPELPEDSTRFIYRAEMGCCTYGYAVTYDGARRILAALSLEKSWAVDNSMSDLCAGADERGEIRCYAAFPNVIGTFRAAGFSSRDSDIHAGSERGDYHDAAAWNLVYSTRLNLKRLLAGGRTAFSQWKQEDFAWSQKEIGMEEFEYPRGYLVGEN